MNLELVVDASRMIKEDMGDWKSYLISVDGVDGSQKSPFARYLSWHAAIPLIETDLFLISGGDFEYRLSELESAISNRLQKDRPVIVEGVLISCLLDRIKLSADFKIFCRKEGHLGSCIWRKHFSSYYKKYKPRTSSNFVYEWSGEKSKRTQ